MLAVAAVSGTLVLIEIMVGVFLGVTIFLFRKWFTDHSDSHDALTRNDTETAKAIQVMAKQNELDHLAVRGLLKAVERKVDKVVDDTAQVRADMGEIKGKQAAFEAYIAGRVLERGQGN